MMLSGTKLKLQDEVVTTFSPSVNTETWAQWRNQSILQYGGTGHRYPRSGCVSAENQTKCCRLAPSACKASPAPWLETSIHPAQNAAEQRAPKTGHGEPCWSWDTTHCVRSGGCSTNVTRQGHFDSLGNLGLGHTQIPPVGAHLAPDVPQTEEALATPPGGLCRRSVSGNIRFLTRAACQAGCCDLQSVFEV